MDCEARACPIFWPIKLVRVLMHNRSLRLFAILMVLAPISAAAADKELRMPLISAPPTLGNPFGGVAIGENQFAPRQRVERFVQGNVQGNRRIINVMGMAQEIGGINFMFHHEAAQCRAIFMEQALLDGARFGGRNFQNLGNEPGHLPVDLVEQAA